MKTILSVTNTTRYLVAASLLALLVGNEGRGLDPSLYHVEALLTTRSKVGLPPDFGWYISMPSGVISR